jgi:hypothetical protein
MASPNPPLFDAVSERFHLNDWATLMPMGLVTPPPQSVSYRNDIYTLMPPVPTPYRGAKVSVVWDHGHRYRAVLETGVKHCWRCQRCGQMITITAARSTSNMVAHMNRNHIGWDEAATAASVDPSISRSTSPATSQTSTSLSTPVRSIEAPRVLTQRQVVQPAVDVDRFRAAVLEWILRTQLPFNIIESPLLYNIFTILHTPIRPYLVVGTTIARWIEADFQYAISQVREWLRATRSRIHITFDIWTSPNGYAMIGIIAHAVEGTKSKVEQVLLALKRLIAGHSGSDIGAWIVDVLVFWGIDTERLGVFVSDNVEANDLATDYVVKTMGINSNQRRGRCAGHIINLAAKAFIDGKDINAFTDITGDNGTLQELKEAQAAWRKRGSIGKLHNIVVYVRASPQRREAFKAKKTGDAKKDGKSAYFSQ